MLIDRITKFGHRSDAILLGHSYCEIGMAYMREDRQKDAIDSFTQARNTYQHVENPSKLDLTWPAIHLGLVYAIQKRGDEINDSLLEVLKIREEAFGEDDTTSFEYVYTLK